MAHRAPLLSPLLMRVAPVFLGASLSALLLVQPPVRAGTGSLPSAEPPTLGPPTVGIVPPRPTTAQPPVERQPYTGPLMELAALTDSFFRVEAQGAHPRDLELLVDERRITLATCHDTAVDPSGVVVLAVKIAPSGRFDARLHGAGPGLRPVAHCMARVIRGFHFHEGSAPRSARVTVELLAPPR